MIVKHITPEILDLLKEPGWDIYYRTNPTAIFVAKKMTSPVKMGEYDAPCEEGDYLVLDVQSVISCKATVFEKLFSRLTTYIRRRKTVK